MYSEEQIAMLKNLLKDHLQFFGYTNHPTAENDTAFFEYNDFDENDLAMFNSFKTENRRVLDEIGMDRKKAEYEFNNGGFMKFDAFKGIFPYNEISFKPHEDGL